MNIPYRLVIANVINPFRPAPFKRPVLSNFFKKLGPRQRCLRHHQSKRYFDNYDTINPRELVSFILIITGLIAIITGFPFISHATSAIDAEPPGVSEEYYTGGKAGTVFNTTSRCLEMPSPAITKNIKLNEQFVAGEFIFDADFVTDPEAPFGGLGPVYNNNSCRNCHPNYGRGRRVNTFTHQFGNSYIAFVHTPDGKIADGYKFMLQTKATPPYVPPAKGVKITWKSYTDEHQNKYPDGTPYNEGLPIEGTLVYPVAELIEPQLPLPDDARVSLEATIGIFGTGLLDAIPDEDIIEEYERQQAASGPVKGIHGPWIKEPYDGKKHLGKFAWHCTRATLMNGPGFNGSWSVTNITREDRQYLFSTQQWIDKQKELGIDTAPLECPQPVEMTEEELENLMVWARGLAVPAARNLNDPEVRRGKALFHAAGCGACHKPSWTTGKYEYIPAYSNQKIWPYTDLLMHDMGKINDGLKKTFRTPPLWARGLMKNAADHIDMWHDLRARNFEEAILWHFGEGSDSREAFRHLTKEDREALIEFCRSL